MFCTYSFICTTHRTAHAHVPSFVCAQRPRTQVDYYVTNCDIDEAEPQYIGIFGDSQGCSIFDVTPEVFSGPCSATETLSVH